MGAVTSRMTLSPFAEHKGSKNTFKSYAMVYTASRPQPNCTLMGDFGATGKTVLCMIIIKTLIEEISLERTVFSFSNTVPESGDRICGELNSIIVRNGTVSYFIPVADTFTPLEI